VAPAKPAQAAPVQAVARGVVGPAKEIPLPRGMRPVTAAPAPKGPQAARTGPAPRTEPAAAQFSRGLSAALRQGGGAVTLRLHPENLGDLKIRLEMEAGKVAAQFRVETAQARQLLDETIGSLRTALEARGLEVQSLSVHVAERTSPAPEARGQPEHSWDQGAGGRGSPEQGGQQNAGGGGGAAHQHGARQRHGAYASGPAGTPPGPLEPIARALGASGGGGLLRLDAVA
jgi:flagellar hook-length control protein FliK